MGIGTVAQEIARMQPLLPTYLHLIISAVFPIYTAAHASLRRPATAAQRPKSNGHKDPRQEEDNDDDDDDESTSPIEALTTSDAIIFPVLAGITLSLLYIIIKWLEDPAILNKLLGYYFGWVGTFFTFSFMKDGFHLLRAFTFPSSYSWNGYLYDAQPDGFQFIKIFSEEDSTAKPTMSFAGFGFIGYSHLTLSKFRVYWKIRRALYRQVSFVVRVRKPLTPSRFQFKTDLTDVAAAISAVTLAMLQLGLKQVPWYLINLSGFSFCYGSLQFITPGTSTTGSLLLSLLFFYDIYMVFYTPMMVTVATKLDVPIKLLFPRPDDGTCPKPITVATESQEMQEYLKCLAKKRTMAMLGLGDVVVPGIMIAYALRFDLYNHYRQMSLRSNEKLAGKKAESNPTQKDSKPMYLPARGMWAERFYTTRELWSPSLRAKSFPKPYFRSTLFGYVAGLIVTVVVMQVYKHAQPALLYLVPGVLSAFWGISLWRHETMILWHYDEVEEDKNAEHKQKEGERQENEKKAEPRSATDDPVKEKSVKPHRLGSTPQSGESRPVFSLDVYWTFASHNKIRTGLSSTSLPKQSHPNVASTQNTGGVEDRMSVTDYDTDSDRDPALSLPIFGAGTSSPGFVPKEDIRSS